MDERLKCTIETWSSRNASKPSWFAFLLVPAFVCFPFQISAKKSFMIDPDLIFWPSIARSLETPTHTRPERRI